MNKKTKIWLCLATFLIIIGVMIFAGVMSMMKWNFLKLSTVKYETNNYKITESYKNISIDTSTADVTFVLSDSTETTIVCHEQKKMKHIVKVENDTLVLKISDTRKWYDHIGINFSSPKITVNIPKGEYGELFVTINTGDLKIPKELTFESIDVLGNTGDVENCASATEYVKVVVSTGNIDIKDISAKNIELSVSTGDLKLTNVKCKSLTSNGDTGNVALKNVVADDKFSVNRSTGDVRFEKCDASEICIVTDTGDVSGSLLTEKVFITSTDTGSINVPKTVKGGKCEITTDTGNIKITIE